MIDKKYWYKSKTIWAALLAFAGVVIAELTGAEIDPTLQGSALAVIMILMRLITKEEIDW